MRIRVARGVAAWALLALAAGAVAIGVSRDAVADGNMATGSFDIPASGDGSTTVALDLGDVAVMRDVRILFGGKDDLEPRVVVIGQFLNAAFDPGARLHEATRYFAHHEQSYVEGPGPLYVTVVNPTDSTIRLQLTATWR